MTPASLAPQHLHLAPPQEKGRTGARSKSVYNDEGRARERGGLKAPMWKLILRLILNRRRVNRFRRPDAGVDAVNRTVPVTACRLLPDGRTGSLRAAAKGGADRPAC